MSSLPREWLIRFERDLYRLSYEGVATALVQIAEGRRKARAPIEIEISPDLSVRTCASPHLRVAEDADESTERAVRSIEAMLEDREAAIRKIARVVAGEQRAFFAGELTSPRRLDPSDIAAAASLPRAIVEMAIQNKLVIHPRGISRLDALIDPEIGPSALLAARPKPPTPGAPPAAAEARFRIEAAWQTLRRER